MKFIGEQSISPEIENVHWIKSLFQKVHNEKKGKLENGKFTVLIQEAHTKYVE